VIGIFGSGAAAVFALLHGVGNGILTIARGTLPLAIFGPENYAYRLGLIGAPSYIGQALAPLAFGMLIEPVGRLVLLMSAGFCVAALLSLMALHRKGTAKVEAKQRDVGCSCDEFKQLHRVKPAVELCSFSFKSKIQSRGDED